jgi:hypothetical protein
MAAELDTKIAKQIEVCNPIVLDCRLSTCLRTFQGLGRRELFWPCVASSSMCSHDFLPKQYYFGDANMLRDNFLKGLVEKDNG